MWVDSQRRVDLGCSVLTGIASLGAELLKASWFNKRRCAYRGVHVLLCL